MKILCKFRVFVMFLCNCTPTALYAFPCLGKCTYSRGYSLVHKWGELTCSLFMQNNLKLQWSMSTLIHPNSQPGKTQVVLISFLLFSALPLQLEKQFTRYHLAQLSSLFCLHSAVSGPGPSRCRWLTHNWDRWMMRPMGCISQEGIQAHL